LDQGARKLTKNLFSNLSWRIFVRTLVCFLIYYLHKVQYIICVKNLTFMTRIRIRIRISMDPHWYSFLNRDPHWGKKTWSGSGLKLMQIHNTAVTQSVTNRVES
jgi:hypothetical protein